MIEGRRRERVDLPIENSSSFRHSLLIRIGGSIVSCVLVAALTFVSAWIELGPQFAWAFNSPLTEAEWDLEELGHAIERVVTDHGSPPGVLTELNLDGMQLTRFNADGNPLDPWGKPYFYKPDGTEFRLGSLGPDGKAGGEGIDADLYYGQTEKSTPTLAQFALEIPTRGALLACLIGGVFAGAATWFLFTPSLAQGSIWSTLVLLALTLGMSVFTAMGMSAVHIPSGH